MVPKLYKKMPYLNKAKKLSTVEKIAKELIEGAVTYLDATEEQLKSDRRRENPSYLKRQCHVRLKAALALLES